MEKIQEQKVFLRRIVQLDFKIKKELINYVFISNSIRKYRSRNNNSKRTYRKIQKRLGGKNI